MIVETHQLTKCFGATAAVDNVSLQVPEGSIYGFLGLNGAGKTTTMRMLLGMIRPTGGSVSLFGQRVPAGSQIWRRVGYMIESTCAYPDLTAEENLQIFYTYHGLEDKTAIDNVVERLNLAPYRHQRAGQLSLGNLQRLGLARALMHRPDLLILDEPVNGLDPSGIVEIRHLLKDLSRQGATILISSHLLSEIAKIADTIGIIHRGRLIRELEASQLQHDIERKLIVDSHDNLRTASILQANGIPFRMGDGGQVEIADHAWLQTPEKIAELVVHQHLGLKKLVPWEEDLESYFLRTINCDTK